MKLKTHYLIAGVDEHGHPFAHMYNNAKTARRDLAMMKKSYKDFTIGLYKFEMSDDMFATLQLKSVK